MGSPLKKKEYGFEFQATNNINKLLSHKQHQQSRKIANAVSQGRLCDADREQTAAGRLSTNLYPQLLQTLWQEGH